VGDLYHYDGTAWQQQSRADSPTSVYGFWGFGGDDVWAAGGFDALSHWDGGSWAPEQDLEGSYNGIWGSAPDDIWAVGDNGMVAHHDGGSWSESSELSVRTNFTMVHGSAPDNVWATAVDAGAPRALVLRLQR
jgi:hypothetical protein